MLLYVFSMSYNQLGKKKKRKYLFIFFSFSLCDHSRTALASSAGDKSWEWTDCAAQHISFSFFFFFFLKAGVSTGNPSRRQRHSLFQLLLLLCVGNSTSAGHKRKENQKHLSASWFSDFLPHHLVRIFPPSSSSTDNQFLCCCCNCIT